MESERAKTSDDADFLTPVWDERDFMHFPHVQYLTLKIKTMLYKRSAMRIFFNGGPGVLIDLWAV